MKQEYWEGRFRENTVTWDIGEISTPLKTYIDQLTDKSIRILIPGGGFGHEANYLWEAGFKNTYILDFSKGALDGLKQRYPLFPSENTIFKNFFEHEGEYDLILEQTFFCAIDPSMRNNYVNHMTTLLSDGGKLVGLLFDCEFENNPPFGGSKQEYLNLFSHKFTQLSMEACYNSIIPRKGKELFFRAEKA